MLAPDAIFARVQQALRTGLPAWLPSAHGYDEMPQVLDGADRAHRSWSVQLPVSAPQAGRQSRAPSQGLHFLTAVDVRWLYRLRTEQRDTDYQAALVDEQLILHALCVTPTNAQLQLQLDGQITRRELPVSTGPMLLGEMHFSVPHQFALGA